MSYQVLARKWRPTAFDQIVGQDHIIRMLSNALSNDRLHHAYLFTGTRGVGKTTLGRILAKCLNCETGTTATPCNTCKACTAVDEGRFLDLIEVDAASRTKVEDTRELLENVQYQPAQGRYKVYLIDEVHMLSGHSFNALLKTLEEPPPHVKFLLATTDPKKLPITVLSRCLKFNLKRVMPQPITDYLIKICEAEKLQFEPEALTLIANAADGSMRDALSLLDQAINFCGEKITIDTTKDMLGTISYDSLYNLLAALAKKDGAQILSEIAKLADMSIDFNKALESLLSILHKLTVIKLIPKDSADYANLQTLADKFSEMDLQLYYQTALIGRRDLPLTPNLQQGFEMVLLRMLAFKPLSTTPEKTTSKIQQKKPVKESLDKSSLEWSEVVSSLDLSGMAKAIVANSELVSINENTIKLAISKSHSAMLNPKLKDRINESLAKFYNKALKLDINIAEPQKETPFKRQEKINIEKQKTATDTINNDSEVQKIIGMFDAKISSVTTT